MKMPLSAFLLASCRVGGVCVHADKCLLKIHTARVGTEMVPLTEMFCEKNF